MEGWRPRVCVCVGWLVGVVKDWMRHRDMGVTFKLFFDVVNLLPPYELRRACQLNSIASRALSLVQAGFSFDYRQLLPAAILSIGSCSYLPWQLRKWTLAWRHTFPDEQNTFPAGRGRVGKWRTAFHPPSLTHPARAAPRVWGGGGSL